MAGTSRQAPLSDRHRHRRHLHRYRLRRYRLRRGQRSPRCRARRPIRRSAWSAASTRSCDQVGAERRTDVAGLAHGTTVATNALLQGQIDSLGLIVTEGFRHILEIARQSVPDGYGNSYFWVKPERIVPLQFVREVGGRFNFAGEELRPLDEDSVRAAARFFREQNIRAIGVCLMHSYANARTSAASAEIIAEEYPECALSLSCDVLPEYREYERAVTTLVDAFVKPHMERYLRRVHDELGDAQGQAVPGHAVERRRGERRPRSCASRSPPRCPVRPPARSAAR